MLQLNIIKDILKNNLSPVGILDSKEIIGINQEDRKGNMYILGRSGQGKTVFLENIIISDLVNSRGGLLIDPFGDIIDDVLEYADKDNIIIFEVAKGDAEFNIAKFNKEIDLVEIKNNKLIMCKLSYPIIGSHISRKVGMHILNEFYKLKNVLKNASLFIDEFHNFVDEGRNIVKNKEYGVKCTISDQSTNYYSKEGVDQLFNTVDHIICYNINSRTAKQVSEGFGFDFEELKNIEQYYFQAKLTINNQKTDMIKARGVFPMPFKKR